jgi:hypothetical protein
MQSVLGNKLKSRSTSNQNAEIPIGVKILNKMSGLRRSKAQKSHSILKQNWESML